MNALTHALVALTAVTFPGDTVRAASLPAEDRPLKITQSFAGNFPESLLAEGITSGFVRAVLHVDAGGRLADHLVLAYTRPQLVTELLAGLREWEFTPPQVRGEPIGTRVEIVFNFEARGAVLSLTAASAATILTRWIGEQVVTLEARFNELDRPLAVLHAAPPFHPGPTLRPPQATGTALIDCYVDETGRTRMAAVVEATHAAFGAAAVDALVRWRFAPPTRAGQPVVVRMRQKFIFNAPGKESRGTD